MTSEEQEAGSRKYYAQWVMRLSTGRFALYNRSDGQGSLALAKIGTWEELQPLVVEPAAIQYLTALPLRTVPELDLSDFTL